MRGRQAGRLVGKDALEEMQQPKSMRLEMTVCLRRIASAMLWPLPANSCQHDPLAVHGHIVGLQGMWSRAVNIFELLHV